MRLRLLFALASASVALAAVAMACSDQSNDTFANTGDASSGTDGNASNEDSGEEEDGATPLGDGGTKADAKADAKAVRDANGPGEAGDDCVFNYDCQLALRCECNGSCSCQPGARGTGKNGIDKCDGGEQCASSLCVEGPGDGGTFYCSDECESNADCTGPLPKCKSISFIGQICVRDGG